MLPARQDLQREFRKSHAIERDFTNIARLLHGKDALVTVERRMHDAVLERLVQRQRVLGPQEFIDELKCQRFIAAL